MKANTEWNLGNFTVNLSVEVTEANFQKLANLGVRFLGQRNSEVDKILGGFEKGADGKQKRKKDWKRTDVEYSDTLRDALEKSFAELDLGDDVKVAGFASIAKYDGPTKAEPKFAREKKKFAEKESTEAGLEAWLKAFCGYAGDSHGEDGEYHPDALAAAKRAIDEFLAKNI